MDVSRDHAELHYGDDYFFGGGAGYPDYLANQELVQNTAVRYERMLREVRIQNDLEDTSQSLFAVGAAAGFELLTYRNTGWTVSGLEPNTTMTNHAAKMFSISLWNGSLEDFSVTDKFSVVTAIQVAAHFRDLRVACDKLSQLVAPKGLLLVETWNFKSWTAKLLGRHWHEYSPPTVLQLFSENSLQSLLKQYGFQMLKLGHPKKYIVGAHAKSLLHYKLRSLLPSRIATALVAPIPSKLVMRYPAEDLFYAIFQRT